MPCRVGRRLSDSVGRFARPCRALAVPPKPVAELGCRLVPGGVGTHLDPNAVAVIQHGRRVEECRRRWTERAELLRCGVIGEEGRECIAEACDGIGRRCAVRAGPHHEVESCSQRDAPGPDEIWL